MIIPTTKLLATLVDRPRRSIALLIGSSVVAGLAEGAAILVVVRVAVDLAADRVSSDFVPLVSAPTGTGVALAIAAALALLTLCSHILIARETSSLSANVLRNGRRRALRAFALADWPTQAKQRLGALQETVSTLCLLSSGLASLIAAGTANLVMLTVFVALGFTINPIGMALVTVAGAAILVVIRPLSRGVRRAGRAFSAADAELAEDTSGFASSAMELRAFGVAEAATAELDDVVRDVAELQGTVRFRATFGTTLYRDIAVLLLVASVGVLSLLDQSAVGSASAIVVLLVRALASAHAVNAMFQNCNERGPTVALLFDRIQQLEDAEDPYGSETLGDVDSYEVRDVTYSYGDGIDVLSGLSMRIERGERVGISGPSGSGKTTLIQLLLRLRRPTSGTILVNGKPYDDYTNASWTRGVAYVPQEPTLFEGSIADNIAFHRDMDRSAIERAAELANVATEIRRLPAGFDTVLGPSGAGLSGGQKQRVAIARALVGSPQLLVLDEPSSALDPAAEGMLRQTIEGLGRHTSVVIVAHRDATLAVCDRIVELDGGRLVASGRA